VIPPPAPTPTGSEYVILKGDTFSLVAKRAGVSPQDIANANPRVDPRRLQIGQKIFVPAPVPSAGVPPGNGNGSGANGGKTYTVKSGDTLSGIASKHATTVKAIRAANNLRTDRIVVDQKLSLPAAPNP
jgi:LysM repeat protein